MRAVVIDDSSTMRGIIRSVLDGLGFETIREFESGHEALQELRRRPVSIVVTEWSMPDISGLEIVRAYRAGGGRAPIVIVTIEASRISVLSAIRAGVDQYLVKPFTPDLLAQRVEESLHWQVEIAGAT